MFSDMINANRNWFFNILDVPEGAEGDEEYWGYRIMMNAAEQAEEFAIAIWHKFQSWKVIHFTHLPQWLQDNDFLHFGHRPPLPTSECFKSIIRIHTETGNIWTHLLGRCFENLYRNLYFNLNI